MRGYRGRTRAGTRRRGEFVLILVSAIRVTTCFVYREKEAAIERGEDGRTHRGLAGAKRTRYNGAQRHGTLTRREHQYAV